MPKHSYTNYFMCIHLPIALKVYSSTRAKDTEALVKISRRLDGGFLTFVLPLILDSLFHKIAPSIFGTNTISMIQNENMSFSQVRLKKRRDRLLQIISISFLLFGTYRALKIIFGFFVSKVISIT